MAWEGVDQELRKSHPVTQTDTPHTSLETIEEEATT